MENKIERVHWQTFFVECHTLTKRTQKENNNRVRCGARLSTMQSLMMMNGITTRTVRVRILLGLVSSILPPYIYCAAP